MLHVARVGAAELQVAVFDRVAEKPALDDVVNQLTRRPLHWGLNRAKPQVDFRPAFREKVIGSAEGAARQSLIAARAQSRV